MFHVKQARGWLVRQRRPRVAGESRAWYLPAVFGSTLAIAGCSFHVKPRAHYWMVFGRNPFPAIYALR